MLEYNLRYMRGAIADLGSASPDYSYIHAFHEQKIIDHFKRDNKPDIALGEDSFAQIHLAPDMDPYPITSRLLQIGGEPEKQRELVTVLGNAAANRLVKTPPREVIIRDSRGQYHRYRIIAPFITSVLFTVHANNQDSLLAGEARLYNRGELKGPLIQFPATEVGPDGEDIESPHSFLVVTADHLDKGARMWVLLPKDMVPSVPERRAIPPYPPEVADIFYRPGSYYLRKDKRPNAPIIIKGVRCSVFSEPEFSPNGYSHNLNAVELREESDGSFDLALADERVLGSNKGWEGDLAQTWVQVYFTAISQGLKPDIAATVAASTLNVIDEQHRGEVGVTFLNARRNEDGSWLITAGGRGNRMLAIHKTGVMASLPDRDKNNPFGDDVPYNGWATDSVTGKKWRATNIPYFKDRFPSGTAIILCTSEFRRGDFSRPMFEGVTKGRSPDEIIASLRALAVVPPKDRTIAVLMLD